MGASMGRAPDPLTFLGAVAEKPYAYDFFQPLWRSDPTVEPALIAAAVKDGAKKADKPAPSDPSKFVDNSFVDAAKQS